MKVVFAADHAGFELKNELLSYTRELGHDVEDMGAPTLAPDDDYNSYVRRAAEAVATGGGAIRGIILGGSGEGEAMLANRYKGVRAAVYYGGAPSIVTLSRQHNDANILSLGARFIDTASAKEAVGLWLATDATDSDRYQRRVKEMDT